MLGKEKHPDVVEAEKGPDRLTVQKLKPTGNNFCSQRCPGDIFLFVGSLRASDHLLIIG